MDIQEALEILEARRPSVRQSIIAQTKLKTFEVTLDQKGRKAVVLIQALGKVGVEAIVAKSLIGKIVKIKEVK
jgi:hypothetical protein